MGYKVRLERMENKRIARKVYLWNVRSGKWEKVYEYSRQEWHADYKNIRIKLSYKRPGGLHVVVPVTPLLPYYLHPPIIPIHKSI